MTPPTAKAAPAEPPLLSDVADDGPKPVGPALLIATICAALLVFVLSLLSAQNDPRNTGTPYTIGAIIGGVAFWPGVILGLFSLLRRFRNARSRCVILLCTWALVALALFGNSLKRSATVERRNQAAAELLRTEPAAPVTETGGAATPETAPAAPRNAGKEPAPAPTAARPVVAPPAFDFSPGSDARLIKQIESAQESTYHDVVRAYAAACRARPADALLALERVRFIERFAYAEDVTFPSAEADLAAAKEYLVAQFPTAASTLLYQLEQLFGDEFNAKVDAVWPHVGSWSASNRARFWLLRAQRASDRPEDAARFAANAFAAEPTADAALQHARGRLREGDAAGARAVLAHPTLHDAPEWQQAERLKLLLEAGAVDEGVALFERLETQAPAQVQTTEMGELLAKAGRVDLARRVYAHIPVQKWNRANVARERFAFELKHGTGEQAAAAYRALREVGFETDPFARERAALVLKHPGAGWGAMDIGSLFALGCLLAFVALLPLTVLLPVHYWGLWRRVGGRAVTWTLSPWGLRSAWLALAAIAVGIMAGLWWFQPDTVRAWADDTHVAVPGRTLGTGELLGPPMTMWVLAAAVALALLARGRAWRLLGVGDWSWGKALGLGAGLALLLKICLGIYITVLGLEGLGMADVSPLSTQFFGAAYRAVGPVAFCALIGVFVPVLEEVLFRGVLLGALAKHVPFWVANTLQSLTFLALHEEMRIAPFFFALAFVNGELVRRSRGLSPGIVLHLVNNTLACVVVMVRGGV